MFLQRWRYIHLFSTPVFWTGAEIQRILVAMITQITRGLLTHSYSLLMKRSYVLFGLLSIVAASCSVDEIISPEKVNDHSMESRVFYASIADHPYGVETKVFANDEFRIRWNADDHITIFEKDTYGAEFKVAEGIQDGANYASFKPVENEYHTGNPLNMYYAIYPYQEGTTISDDGVISFVLPEEQTYLNKSFGKGANTMVSMTESKNLMFKNAGGYLCFKLYGDNVSVASVILQGNGGEALAGDCTIEVSNDGIPNVVMSQEGSTNVIRLKCDEPVIIGSSADNYTEFWFVLPPTEFKQSKGGFTLIVATSDGGIFTQEAPMDLPINRNEIQKMAPLKVTPKPQTLSLDSVSSKAGGYGVSVKKADGSIYYNYASFDEGTCTYTITLPTVTDFSELVFDYTFTGDKLMVGDQVIVSGETPIDASSPVTIKVCKGFAEKDYTLIAQNTGLPVVRITTTPDTFTRETIEADRVYTQSSGWGERTKIDERIWRPSKTSVDSSVFVRFESSDGELVQEYKTQIKGRGNATWKYDKRPYALKLLEKKPVSFMPEHKRWILLANWKDRTLLRNDVAFWLSRQTVIRDPEDENNNLGLPYTVRGQFVELEFNGEHRGNYYLCEQIKIDVNRVNISEWKKKDTEITGGFMMEIDNNYDEANKFKSQQFKLKYMFKDPDEDLTTAATDYMKNFINTLEGKIKNASNGQYRADFDIDSAIWFMFVNELTGNGDFYNENYSDEYKGPHSTYLYKDKGGKLTLGPVWDFDYLTFMTSRSSKWAGANQSSYYFKSLCSDPVFRARLVELWDLYKSNLTGFEDYVNSMADQIRESEKFNTTMWGYSGQDQDQNEDNTLDFQAAVNRMKTAFSNKLTWMDSKFNDDFTTFN